MNNRKTTLSRCLLSLSKTAAWILGTCLATNGATPPFVAKGDLTIESFMPGQAVPRLRMEFAFRFTHSNGWWEVETLRKNAQNGVGEIENCSVVPGGVRHYVLFHGRTNDRALNAALVCPIAFPPPSKLSLFQAWLSLCPNAELPLRDETHIYRFLDDIPSCSDLLQFQHLPLNIGPCVLEYQDDKRSFLRGIKISNQGASIIAGADSQPAIRNFPAPFDKGFVDYEFNQTATTNVGGILLPLATRYQHYLPDWATQAPDDLYVATRCALRVLEYQFEGLELLVPVPKQKLC